MKKSNVVSLLASAVLLLACGGCGKSTGDDQPSREIQYIQAAEEVKAEESRLAEINAEITELDENVSEIWRLFEMKESAIVDQEIGKMRQSAFNEKENAGVVEKYKKGANERRAETAARLEPTAAARKRLEMELKQQEKSIAAARARRDSLSPQAK